MWWIIIIVIGCVLGLGFIFLGRAVFHSPSLDYLADDYDSFQQQVMNKALETGKPVFGHLDDDGRFTMEVIEDDAD